MLVHGLLLERVDLRGLGGSARGNDVLGERIDRCPEAPGEKDLGALSRKGACDSAADRASGSVEHRNLVLQRRSLLLDVRRRNCPPSVGIRRGGGNPRPGEGTSG